MKANITAAAPTSNPFTATYSVDVKVGGVFTGAVWLESQAPGETTWEIVPGTVSDRPNQYRLDILDSTIQYRFNSNITSGTAVGYVDATEVV